LAACLEVIFTLGLTTLPLVAAAEATDTVLAALLALDLVATIPMDATGSVPHALKYRERYVLLTNRVVAVALNVLITLSP
jgi:hypothetical protein